MKNRAYFLMLAATTLLSAPALAAPVFMLQFGSFESMEEAQTRLSALRSEHAGVIGSMQSGVREVTLPPDNLVVYRTQAGPVETRAAAQSICGQLASNGDECYVVETAMAPSFATNTQVAQAAPAAQTAAVSAATPATTAVRNPAGMSNAALMAPGASTTAPQAVPPVNMAPLPLRDPSNAAAIGRVTTPPAIASANVGASAPMAVAAASPASAVSPAMQQAMDEAAAEQNTNTMSKLNNAPTPAGAKEEGTFWSRLNPFSSSEPKPAVAPAPVMAKAETVETPVVEMAAVETPPAIPAPLTPPPPMVTSTPEPLSPLPQDTAPVAIAPAAAPAPMLPPPPAPLIGKGSINAAQSTAASLRAPAPVVVPQPTGSLNTPAPIVIGDNTGNVRVGEAQRVPLSQIPAAPPAAPMSMANATLLPAPTPALSPSSTLGQKTLWAHVGQFVDAQAALSFWDNYRRSHPDFPVVRVRVTSPLQSLTHGNDKVSLRVGPFAKDASIRTLCTTISEQQKQIKGDRLICGSIVDMGIASRVGGQRNGYLPGSRYQR